MWLGGGALQPQPLRACLWLPWLSRPAHPLRLVTARRGGRHLRRGWRSREATWMPLKYSPALRCVSLCVQWGAVGLVALRRRLAASHAD